MVKALVALGANLGDRTRTLESAVTAIAAVPGIAVLAQSGWHATAPIGGPPGQAPFLNGAVLLETSLEPAALMGALRSIEQQMGRQRHRRWEARTIDLDLLLYGQQQLGEPGLVVPHPRMAVRRFVLAPAAQIAPDMLHPGIGWTVEQLLAHARNALPYAAVTGPARAGKSEFVSALVARLAAAGMPSYRLKETQPMPDATSIEAAGTGPAGPDPYGLPEAQEIQFLAQRAELLARAGWSDATAWALSDFWFDESLAWAAVLLGPAGQDKVRETWSKLRDRVVQPKVLFVLEEPERAAQGSSNAAAQGDLADAEHLLADAHERQFRMELKTLTARQGIGPVLRLNACNAQDSIDEAIAALTAIS